MKKIVDITQAQGSDYPMINVYDVKPRIKKLIQILQQKDNQSPIVTILGFEQQVECIAMAIPLSIEKLLDQYPDMTHFAIIHEPKDIEYTKYIGKEIPLAIIP